MSGYNEIHTQLLLQDLLNEMVAARSNSSTVGDRITSTETDISTNAADIDTLETNLAAVEARLIAKFSDYTNIATMISTIGSTPSFILCDSAETLTANATFPTTMQVMIVKGGSITLGDYDLTINGPFQGSPGCFVQAGTGTVSFGAGAVDAVRPEWVGTDAAAINWAVNAQTGGGLVDLADTTYTVDNGTIIMSTANTTLRMSRGTIISSTSGGDDFTIKVTGSKCTIEGGTIQCPNSPGIFTGSLANLRKAVVWLDTTADDFTIKDTTFLYIPSLGIFNEGSDRLLVDHCNFSGGYTSWETGDGNNHFAYYQDGGSDNKFVNNVVTYCVMGFGSGVYEQSPGTRMVITGNTFDCIGQHPVYIASGGDYSVVCNNTQKNCGSSFALTGNYIQCNNNNIHMDASLWTSGSTYQSGLSLRNAIGCECIGNVFSGKGYQVILGLENTGAGTTIRDNIIANNKMYLSDGSAYAAIRVGSSGTTTTNQRISVIGNNIYFTPTANYHGIVFYGTGADDVLDCDVFGNTIESGNTNSWRGIQINYGINCSVENNRIISRQTYTGSTNMYGVYLKQCGNTECSCNKIITTEATNLALYGFYESGTNAQVYNNRYIENKFKGGATGGNLIPYTLIASNNSEIIGGCTSDTYTANTVAAHYLRLGNVFFLTASGGARNFNPGEAVYPKNYPIEIYNNDGANAITFDSTGLNCAIAAGKHGIFRYTGTAWKGSQVD